MKTEDLTTAGTAATGFDFQTIGLRTIFLLNAYQFPKSLYLLFPHTLIISQSIKTVLGLKNRRKLKTPAMRLDQKAIFYGI